MKVYEYGLLQPTLNVEVVKDQIRRAHRYYNCLIEIERTRRMTSREAQARYGDVGALQTACDGKRAELAAVRSEIRQKRKNSRRGTTDAGDRAAAARLRQELRDATQKLKAAKVAVRSDATLAAEFERVSEAAKAAVRAARADSGLYWGTYLLIEQAVDAARKSKIDPTFHRWIGSGAVGVQLQGGLPTAEVFGNDMRLRIDPVSEEAWTHPRRGERRRLSRTRVRLRVGSDGRAPIWAEWPMVMHRRLPEGAIKWAKVLMRPGRPWPLWVLQLTVDEEQLVSPRPGVVAIDLGWRNRPEGELRVAYWVGNDGREGELRLSSSVRTRMERAESIRGIRDKNLDALKVELPPLLENIVLPDPLQERLKSLAAWRSPGRFVWLGDALREADVAPEARARLDVWRRRDLHLWQYETGLRQGAIRHRRELFRRFAAELASAYGTIVVEDMDLRKLSRLPKSEDGPAVVPAAHQRTIASPGLLRDILVQAAASAGGESLAVPSVNTTRTCHVCRRVNTALDAARTIWLTCACGVSWDQDANAARNMLASAEAMLEAGEPLAPDNTVKKKRKPKWSKRHGGDLPSEGARSENETASANGDLQ